MADSLLPQRILPPSAPWLGADGVTVAKNWWLFLYNLSQSVLGQADPVALQLLAELDADVATSDDQRLADGIDAAQMLSEQTPVPFQASQTAVADDYTPPNPQAQPVQAITVGASAYVYTAPFDGMVTVSGGTVTGLDISRDGTTYLATGVLAGAIPVSRLDKLKVTYAVAPTMTFFPR
ncbi:hypothetical protein UFOVP154_35 [uncultured Caudovirales phage]|uniref:Uncharacterized protein n=1 Tax=uncultured Caudovirales phage TaxID=2100421 RepID=A0A6J7WC36_9CAUD|nr:hypothetical protein UFOVP8_20 [uncultured Caudovirales phage]CAB5170592.1 hypothetical protein UFOVP154_35 [uncultured Caudovirales phage]